MLDSDRIEALKAELDDRVPPAYFRFLSDPPEFALSSGAIYDPDERAAMTDIAASILRSTKAGNLVDSEFVFWTWEDSQAAWFRFNNSADYEVRYVVDLLGENSFDSFDEWVRFMTSDSYTKKSTEKKKSNRQIRKQAQLICRIWNSALASGVNIPQPGNPTEKVGVILDLLQEGVSPTSGPFTEQVFSIEKLNQNEKESLLNAIRWVDCGDGDGTIEMA